MKKSTSKLQMPTIVFSAAAMLALFAILSFALPSVTFQPPTLSDNATTGLNWVFVNVTSSEDLNQSLLEWGNSTGFTNVSMINVSGMTNWYVNITGLVDGTYNYTVWAENTTGGWNWTGRRFVTVAFCNPPGSGDWSITGNTVCENQDIVLNGSILISGKLVLNNVSVTLNETGYSDYTYKLNITETGNLTAYNNTQFKTLGGYYYIDSYGNLYFEDVKLNSGTRLRLYGYSNNTFRRVINATVIGANPLTVYTYPFFFDNSNTTIIDSMFGEPRIVNTVNGGWINISNLEFAVPTTNLISGTTLRVDIQNTTFRNMEFQLYDGNTRIVNVTNIYGDIYIGANGYAVDSVYFENVSAQNLKEVRSGNITLKNFSIFTTPDSQIWKFLGGSANMTFIKPYSNLSAIESFDISLPQTIRGYIAMPDASDITITWDTTGKPNRYFPVYTNWSNGSVYDSANVSVYDLNNNFITSIITNSSGYGEINITFNQTNYGAGNFSIYVRNQTGDELKGDINFFNDTVDDLVLTATSISAVQTLDGDVNQFWVRIDGNDSCTGQNNMSYAQNSTDCAWLTIGKAAGNITAGQTVRVQSGTYNEGVTVSNSGTSANRIRFLGDGYPRINGTSSGFTVSSRQFLDISGFNITVNGTSVRGIFGANVAYLNISNNIINSSSGEGIYLEPVNHTKILNNTIWAWTYPVHIDGTLYTNTTVSGNSIRGSVSSGTGSAIYIWGSATNINISYNNITESSGNAIRFNICDNCYAGHNDISGNVKHNGVDFHGVRNSISEYNYIHDISAGDPFNGIYVDGSTYPNYNNTFRNDMVERIDGLGFGVDNAYNGTVINLTVRNTGRDGFQVTATPAQTLYASGNWYLINSDIQNTTLNGYDVDKGFGDFWIINTTFINATGGDCPGKTYCFDSIPYQNTTFRLINQNRTDYQFRLNTNGTVVVYYYADINVTNGTNPISDVNVSFSNLNDTAYPPVSLDYQNITWTITGSDGHTPLPSNTTWTVAMPDYKENATARQNFTISITATKSEYNSNSTIVDPDASWYRGANPDTYQNTTTIVLQSAGTTPVSACTNLSVANTYYTLTQNVSSSGTCFNITANNVTLDGQGYWVNYSTSQAGYGVNITGRNNVTVKNLNVVQGNSSVSTAYGVYGLGMTNSNITNNIITTSGSNSYSVYLYSSSNSNNVSNNNIVTSNSNSFGIRIALSSTTNTLSNNNITTFGFGGYGIQIQLSDNNILLNNTILTNGGSSYGIHLDNSNINSLTGGSIISKQSSDYYLQTAGTTNNFTNVNFTTQRQIGFNDVTSWFNYNNDIGNIWLKTNVSTAGYLNRTLIVWSNTVMKWNDTNSTSNIIANYNLTGLMVSTQYNVYNTSTGTQTNPYTITTDNNGALNFTINLNSNTEILVSSIGTSPAVILNSPINNFNQTSPVINFNCTAYDAVNLTNVTLYNNLGGIWQANGTNSSGINNTAYNFSRIAPSNGTFTWNCLAYNNASLSSFASQNFTVTMDAIPPALNTPANASYTQNSSATIGWILYDNYAGGYYIVYRNGTMQNQSAWQNNTNLNIWVNTSTQGTWSYTITYNDSLGNNGIPNAVIINITGDTTPPQYSLNSTNSTTAGTSIKHSLYWTDNANLSGYVFSFDNGNGTFYNDSWVAFTGTGNWSNVTKTVNSTVGATIRWKVFVNDTSNNWNTSTNYSYITTNYPPTYSNIGTNNTIANQSTKFYAYWTGDVGLSAYVFSTNNSGEWVNQTYSFAGTGNWSNATITINSTSEVSIGYRFYANDTNNQWNDTGIQTMVTTSAPTVNCTKYVATYGNNSKDGASLANAWRNVSYAAQQAQAGDTICLVNGIWYGEQAVFTNSGNATHPIVVTAYNGTPTMNGVSQTGNGFQIGNIGTGKSYVNIYGITITNYNTAIYTRESSHMIFENLTIYNLSYIAVWFVDGVNLTVKNNTIHDIGFNALEITTASLPTSNISIINNRIYDDPGYSGGVGHGLIDLENNAGAYTLTDVTIVGNELYNAVYGAIYPHGHIQEMYRVNITNNTIYNTSSVDVGFLKDSTINDNIIYGNANYGIHAFTSIGNSTFSGNTVYGVFAQVQMNTSWGNITLNNNNISYYRIDEGTATVKNVIPAAFTIQSAYGGQVTLQFDNGAVFSENGANIVKYYPNRSEYQTIGNEAVSITTYNLTARPATGYLNITVNKFNTTTDIYNITVNSSNAENPTWFNLTAKNANAFYNVKRDGSLYTTIQSGSDKVVRFFYNDTGDDWSAHTFEFSPGISVSLNSPSDTLLTNNATQIFNCSASSGNPLVNISLYTNQSGWSAKNTTNITGTSNSSQWINTLADGSYAWNCLAYDNTGNSSFATANYTLTIDTTPPSTITNLQNQSQSDTWIYWNWTNPGDFNHSEIYLNGTWKQNTSLSYYNATDLNASTWYQISIRTVDLAGNINQTWVNSTARTIADTTPPVINVTYPTNGTAFAAGKTETWINITTDENATCRYNLTNSSFVYVDGTNFTNTGGSNHSFLYSGLTDNTAYGLYYLCNDTYGNVNSEATHHTFSVSSAAVIPTTPSGGGGGSGGTTTVQNKTNQTTKNTTITIPTTQNTTNTTIVPQDEIKQRAQEKINEVSQKIKPEDLAAKQKLSEAESAYATGQYDKAYSLAVEAEGLIGNGVTTQGTEPEKKPYLVYAITALVIFAAWYALRKGYVKMNPKKIAVTEEPKEISGESVDRQGTSSSGDVEMEDIQKRLEEVRRKLRE